MFYDEFSRLIEILVGEPDPLAITGDFNFHVDDSGNLEAMRFLDLLDSANLVQHVLEPTHRRGHTLDLIITRRDEGLIRHVKVLPDIYSDHRVIVYKIDCPRPPLSNVLVTFRSKKKLDSTKLHNDISECFSKIDLSTIPDINDLISKYNLSLTEIYDAVTPIQSRWVKHRPHAPWYSDNLRQVKHEKRRLERKYRKSSLKVHKQLFEDKCIEYNVLIDSCKKNYYKSKIEQADRNQLFRLIDRLFTIPSTKLPIHESLDQLFQEFNDFLSIRFEI